MAHTLARKLKMAIAGTGLLVMTVAASASVGAAAPPYLNAYTANGCAVGDNVCLNRAYVAPYGYGYYGSGYPYAPAVGYAYRDNRYCDDGNVIATPYGYRCANGSPLYVSGTNVRVSGYPVVNVPIVAVGTAGYTTVGYYVNQ